MILNTTKAEGETLPNLRKAAMLLVALGEGSSAELLQQLTEEEVQKVSREVAKLTAISAEQAEAVLEEFHQIANAGDYVARGGIDYARKLLMRAFEPDQAKRLLDRLTKALGADAASFDAIQKADPQQLAKFIHNEHPQTIALVLSHLNYSQAAALLTSLPADHAGRHLAAHGQPGPDLSRDHPQDRRRHRAEAEGARRIQPRILRRRARRGGDVQPPGFHLQPRDPRPHRPAGHQPGRDHPPPDVRLRRPAADRPDGPEGSPGQGGSQGADGRAQGHQRTVAQPHPELHVAARRGHAARGHGIARAR